MQQFEVTTIKLIECKCIRIRAKKKNFMAGELVVVIFKIGNHVKLSSKKKCIIDHALPHYLKFQLEFFIIGIHVENAMKTTDEKKDKFMKSIQYNYNGVI